MVDVCPKCGKPYMSKSRPSKEGWVIYTHTKKIEYCDGIPFDTGKSCVVKEVF